MVKELRPDGEQTADLEPPAATAARVDRAARGGHHVLHDRETEPRATRGTRAIGTVETLEESRQVGLVDAGAVEARGARGEGLEVRCEFPAP